MRQPAGCERNLSGTYVHVLDPRYRYDAQDDGRVLRLSARVEDTTSFELELTRGPQGFLGETRGFGYSARGAKCPVSFRTEVQACPAGGLTLGTAPEVSIDDECNPMDPAPETTLIPHELRAVSPDAG